MSAVRDVGIIAMEVYFPKLYVDQGKMELFDGVPAGKYTIGLAQGQMAYVDDTEDINSMCLSVLDRLLTSTKISPSQIGRLEIGTESRIDMSKATKTILMDLLGGNSDVDGVDVVNACYGGTCALFNAVNWLESGAYDGRYALVIAADIAVYASGPARPTGGAGAVAMLIGPNAPIVLDSGRSRAIYSQNTWDFYKPNANSDYPIVDGPLSNECYLRALKACFELYAKKATAIPSIVPSGEVFSFEKHADYICLHSPYNKLVQKSVACLCALDALRLGKGQVSDAHLKTVYEAKAADGTWLNKKLGNCYTASLYLAFLSLLQKQGDNLINRRILMFSYGSGLASAMFSLVVKKSAKQMLAPLNLVDRLADRTESSLEDYTAALERREESKRTGNFSRPATPMELFEGAYYLVEIDALKRRRYTKWNGHFKVPPSSSV